MITGPRITKHVFYIGISGCPISNRLLSDSVSLNAIILHGPNSTDFDRFAADLKHINGQTTGEAIVHDGYCQMVPYLSSVITWHPSVRMQIFSPCILIFIYLYQTADVFLNSQKRSFLGWKRMQGRNQIREELGNSDIDEPGF